VVFAGAFYVMEKVMPFSIRKEIEEDHNVALGIIIAGGMIAIALVISAAVSG
jgi:putative membrane protein